MSDEVRIHGVTVGRANIRIVGTRHGKTVAASLRFTPDHVGIMHAGARALDKGEDR